MRKPWVNLPKLVLITGQPWAFPLLAVHLFSFSAGASLFLKIVGFGKKVQIKNRPVNWRTSVARWTAPRM
jgi:hypothetical protein